MQPEPAFFRKAHIDRYCLCQYLFRDLDGSWVSGFQDQLPNQDSCLLSRPVCFFYRILARKCPPVLKHQL